ncbi:MAG TPA: methyltransferase domain-containing protein [Polyangiaceae bacterium]|nr:methyltransferase domain-containing protein [Polyangiaceae bacterium]
MPKPVEPSPDAPVAAARRRLSLRIPDDEIARPKGNSPETVAPGEPPPVNAGPLTPTRIITINPEPGPANPVGPLPPSAPPTDPDLMRPGVRPPLDSIPDAEPTPRRSVPVAAESSVEVEVRFEDDAMGPVTPRVQVTTIDGDRRSDPGDAPELAAEDLVAVDPTPAPKAVDLPPMRPRAPSQTSLAPAPPSAAPPLNRPLPAPSRPPLVIVPPHVGSMPQQPAEGTQRRKGRLWWEELFNDDYVRATEKITDEQIAREVHFIEESLGVERGGAILDLGCGTGRHAIELARNGYEVVGFDLSLAMLARAGEDAQERHAKLNFVQGDMRDLAFEEQFDGVYCWNTSFGYFEEDKNAQIVDRVRRALKGGGLFLLDVVNRDFLIRQSPSLAWFEGDGCVCMDEMSLDFITSRMKIKRTMMVDDGRSREIEYSMRVYSLHELGRILHEHGFKVREVSGRIATPGVFFGNESPRAIILAEKR